jgi:DUF4097 and DUF4098 domain-containing protein YvlB
MFGLSISSPVSPALLRLGAVSLVAVGAFGCVVTDTSREYRETSQVELEFAPQTNLVIENTRGTIRLVESDSGELEVEATKRVRSRDTDEAEEISKDIQVDLLREGEDLRIVVEYPRSLKRYRERTYVMGFDVSRPSGAVDLLVALPSGTPVRVDTRSGDLSVDEFAGALHFESSSGDVRLEEFVGDVYISSKSGDVYISRLDGELEMETSSGDLSVRNALGDLSFDATSGDLDAERIGGELSVTTASGDIDIEEALGATQIRTTSGDVTLAKIGGRFQATTASGDVVARMVQPLEEAYIRTSGGDIYLVLTDPLRGRLQVNTSSGEISVPIEMGLESIGKGRLVAVLGPGSGSLEVKTSSGDVDIHRAETALEE